MDRKTYTAKVAELRPLRGEIVNAEKAAAAAQVVLGKLHQQRARQITELAGYEGAKADTIAKASGLSVGDVVRIAPVLDPTPAAIRAAGAGDRAAAPVQVSAPAARPAPVVEPVAAVAPALTRPASAPELAVERPAPAGVEVGDQIAVEQPASASAGDPAAAVPAAEQPAPPPPPLRPLLRPSSCRLSRPCRLSRSPMWSARLLLSVGRVSCRLCRRVWRASGSRR